MGTDVTVSVDTLVNAIQASGLQEDFEEERNTWVDGMYVRELDMKQGLIVVGHIHKKNTINILSKGSLLVKTKMEDEWTHIEAPYINVTPPNTRKILYTLEDCTFVNVIRTDETTIEKTYLDVAIPEVGSQLYNKYNINQIEDKEEPCH